MKKRVIGIILLVLLGITACAPHQYGGATAGGAIGGVTGAIIDSSNPWRGGVIGAVIGAIAGATIADISVRGSREVYTTGRPVEYTTEDRRGRYYAEPLEYNSQTKCRKVREKVWEDGRLVRDTVREVCEGERIERRY